ncbi:MAG: hypothetical protein K0R66_1550 [Gammaproteobacteria bacterium]|jgi:long-chain fatty acid transport protein|nr:hypothetical protein [Gammaproteobacteria bacterium]
MASRSIKKMGFNLAFIATSLALAGSAYAAGFAINEMSPSIQATALAGAAATTDDVTAIAFNPATLASLQHSQVYAGASYIAPHVSYANATASTDGAPITGSQYLTSESNVAQSAIVPNFYAGIKTTGPVNFGLAVTAPWGMATAYQASWVGQNNALDSKLESIDIAPTISYQVNPELALGAAVHAERVDVNYSNSVVTSLYNSDLTGTAWGYGYSLGALFTPKAGTNLGIAYRSSINESITGTNRLEFYTGAISTYNAYTSIKLPNQVVLSASQQLTNKWTGLATAEWTNWASFNSLDISIPGATVNNINLPMNWSNTWTLSLGAKYQINNQWQWRVGAATDPTPTNDTDRDARIPDSNRYWLTTGIGYQPTQNLEVDLTYERIFMNNQSIDVTQTIALPENVAADYSGYANIVAAGIRYIF